MKYDAARVSTEDQNAAMRRRLFKRAGMKAARGPGVKFGRKPKLSPEQLAHARQLLDAGKPVPEVAGLLGVAHATIYRRAAA